VSRWRVYSGGQSHVQSHVLPHVVHHQRHHRRSEDCQLHSIIRRRNTIGT
jgi:hypothetical protein